MARILIVEDSYLQAADMERILLEAGYDVVGIAPLTAIATAIARVRPPDLLICDLQLALDLDGVKTAAVLHRQHGCRVLIATGRPDAVAASEVGTEPCGVLRKPFTESGLLAAVESCLR